LSHRPGKRDPDIGVENDEVAAHLARVGLHRRVAPGPIPGTVRLVPLTERHPRVTVIVPTAGRGRPRPLVTACLAALDRTEGVELDVIVVVDTAYTGDPEDLLVGRHHPTRLLERPPGPFDFAAACNRGLVEAGGDAVLLLNDDVEALDPLWLARMVAHLDDPGVGVVGARLVYPDHTLQHIGVVIDDARPLHPFVGASLDHPGPWGLLRHPREVVAVTGACLLARRTDLVALGGLSREFPLSFNDTDLCLKMLAAGRRVVVEPDAVCIHHESASRAPQITSAEWDAWIARWGAVEDPWYHPAYHRPRHEDRRLDADHLPPSTPPDPRRATVRDTVIRPRVHRSPAHAAARAGRPRADTRVRMPELTPADGADAPGPGPGHAEDPALGEDPVALRLEILRLRDVAAGAAARTAVLEDRVHELEDELERFEGLMEAHQALIARHEALLAHPVLRAQRLLGRVVGRVSRSGGRR
ncbi:MAG: glycosyltransferase family 2 protein, partial [Actinomyces sp.]